MNINKKNHQSSIVNHKLVRGFTLIELLIVIAIIGVLATLLMANFVGVRQRARDAQRKSDIRQLQSALEIYRSDNGGYPASPLPGCGGSLIFNGSTYMQKIPCDPNGGNYNYALTATGGYNLYACLENGSDSQKDAALESGCSPASFTVTNP